MNENSSACARGETVNACQCPGSAELLHSQELLCPASVNPQLLCLLEVSASSSTGAHSLLRPIWGRAKGRSTGRDKSGKNLTWAVTQLEPCAEDMLSSSCGCFPVQATWTQAVQTYCCPQSQLQCLGVWGRTLNYTTAQLLKFNRGKKTARGRFSSIR